MNQPTGSSHYEKYSIPKRIYWRVLSHLGLKKMSWDKQFEAGVWPGKLRSPHVVNRVMDLCNNGSIIEFGAGEGTLPYSLPINSFSTYTGYDISAVAVMRATERAHEAGLKNCYFEQCDMAQWKGSSDVSLVVLEECIYYLSARKIETFLNRCCESLAPSGHILIIVYSASKHTRSLDVCRRVCKVVDESVIKGRTFITLARPET
jgi:cyclopropane fatty-acyl-phospholipid synthase-like methyltransferase